MGRLIDADKVTEAISWLNEYDFIIWHDVMEHINKLPTVDAEPIRHAHWEQSKEDGALFCSHCGRPTYDSHDEWVEFNGIKVLALVYPYYCGYCGCKMDETDEVTE